MRLQRALLAMVFLAFTMPACGLAQSEAIPAMLARSDALDGQLKNREALAVLMEAEKRTPNDAEVLRRVAKQYAAMMVDTEAKSEKIELGNKALGYAKRAVAADPRNGMAQLSLAICYGRLAPLLDNRTQIAYSKLVKEGAERALALSPSEPYVYHVLGAWHLEIATLNPFLRGMAKLIYGDIPSASLAEAERMAKKALALAPAQLSHTILLGRIYAAMGKQDLARTYLTKGLAMPDREKDDPFTKGRGRDALRRL